MTPDQAIKAAKAKGLKVEVSKTASEKLGMLKLPRNSKAPEVRTTTPLRWAIEFSLPCRILSEPNQRGHWAIHHKRRLKQAEAMNLVKFTLGLHLMQVQNMTPCRITLTHIGPRIDNHDNLTVGLKSIADMLARWLEVANDDDGRIQWEYQQRRGPAGVEVRIESRNDAGQPTTMP